jgi:hypothetical protein
MNSGTARTRLAILASLHIVFVAAAWSQGAIPRPAEGGEHRETEDLFREIERRLGRIDVQLQDAGARAETSESLRATRADGAFVLSAIDRLLEIQVHHSGPGG